ncbi:hypothetical protein FQA39_LY02726 [Lamprigera yunnana]|nr:hypothetical protein FQA39_LY02726 [Lamprigera yunnana]
MEPVIKMAENRQQCRQNGDKQDPDNNYGDESGRKKTEGQTYGILRGNSRKKRKDYKEDQNINRRQETIQRENQSELEQEFWKTIELLISKDRKCTEKDVFDDVQDWVDNVVSKRSPAVENESLLTGSSKKSNRSSSDYDSDYTKKMKHFLKNLSAAKFDCKFSHPYVRSRLEKLMGTNVIFLTDRVYMQQLQERILEDYANEMNKRIAVREANETERVKCLVLSGIIPFDEAPPEMIDHPVRLIEMYCRKIIAERRAKMKLPKELVPKRTYPDDTPDPGSGLTIEDGHLFRSGTDELCHSPQCLLDVTNEEDVNRGYMFTEEEYAKFNLESPLIQKLRESQTVEEMYALADQILELNRE